MYYARLVYVTLVTIKLKEIAYLAQTDVLSQYVNHLSN